MKIRGIGRVIAVITLSVILLPIIFTAYFSLTPESTPQEIAETMIKTIPLGEQIWGTFVDAIKEGSSGFESALGWFENTEIDAGEFIVLEAAQIFLTSVIMLALESLIDLALKSVDTGIFLNNVANILYKIMVVFGASLIAKGIYDFFINEVSKLTDTSQSIMIYTVAIISVVGGIIALIIGKGFVRSALKCTLKTMEIFVTYALCISLFLEIFPWIAIVIVWILVIWGFYFVEKLIK